MSQVSETICKHLRSPSIACSELARMKTVQVMDCPFCDFIDYDHFFLLRHVETNHPEGDRPSPFAIREELAHQLEPPASEMEGARDDSSEYLECQCGEFCFLTEIESHLEMHHAEGMGADELLRAPADATNRPSNALPPRLEFPSRHSPLEATSSLNQSFSIRPAIAPLHRKSSRKSGSTVRGLMDALRHSTSSSSSKLSQAARNRVPRRLGVRESDCLAIIYHY